MGKLHIEPEQIAEFLRTLGQVAPLVGVPGVSVIAGTLASLIEAGGNISVKLKALTSEMKARAEAGVETTAQEILADVARITVLDKQIQDV